MEISLNSLNYYLEGKLSFYCCLHKRGKIPLWCVFPKEFNSTTEMGSLFKPSSSNVLLKCIQSSADLIETEFTVKSAPGSPETAAKTKMATTPKRASINRQSCQADLDCYSPCCQKQSSNTAQQADLPARDTKNSAVFESYSENRSGENYSRAANDDAKRNHTTR